MKERDFDLGYESSTLTDPILPTEISIGTNLMPRAFGLFGQWYEPPERLLGNGSNNVFD